MKTQLISLVFILLPTLIQAQTPFHAQVVDISTKKPIPFAEIYFPELETGTLADENGRFSIEHYELSEIELRITAIGYEPLETKVKLDEREKTFFLKPSYYQLQEIVVSVPTGKLQMENIVHVSRKKINELQLTAPLNMAEAISNIPGLEQNTTGPGIGKPVIRGLSGNRIVTYAQNIRVENQQWGDEHGLGIGEIGIGSVEVIKGPASLLYGSDALGGVLFFVDEPYARHDSTEAFLRTRVLSNTFGNITQAGFKTHKGAFKWNLFGAYATHADYRLPSGEFASNTRFDERNVKTAFGFNKGSWIGNLRYSYLLDHFGLTEAPFSVVQQERKIVLPQQTISDHNLSLENIFISGESEFKMILGYTDNYRREFEDDPNHPALGLRLSTFTYQAKWSSPVYSRHFYFLVGAQGMIQQNKNDGEEFLIPDAQTRDLGLFGLFNFRLKQLQWQAGLRFDQRNLQAFATGDIPPLKTNYQGVSFSTGASWTYRSFKLRTNLSRGFRAPNTSELLAMGIHEGANRYEKGKPDLENEQATQIDFSLTYSTKHLQLALNTFYNHIQNYIYLNPTEEFIDNTPVFEYRQSSAYLYGGETGFHYHPHQLYWLHMESNFSLVLAENQQKQPLPLIPQPKITTTLRTEIKTQKRKINTQCYVQHIYKFPQNRTALFETSSPDYHLINLGVSARNSRHSKYAYNISLGVKNAFNTEYIDHLSRFKTLGVPNPGRNFYLELGLRF